MDGRWTKEGGIEGWMSDGRVEGWMSDGVMK